MATSKPRFTSHAQKLDNVDDGPARGVSMDLDLGLVDVASAIRAGRPHLRRLCEARPVEPLPAQREIFERAVARARLLGLEIPRFSVRWCDTRELRAVGHGGGATVRYPNGTLELFVSAYLFPSDLLATVLHELQHVYDLSGPDHAHLTDEELERRALAFAARAMGGT